MTAIFASGFKNLITCKRFSRVRLRPIEKFDIIRSSSMGYKKAPNHQKFPYCPNIFPDNPHSGFLAWSQIFWQVIYSVDRYCYSFIFLSPSEGHLKGWFLCNFARREKNTHTARYRGRDSDSNFHTVYRRSPMRMDKLETRCSRQVTVKGPWRTFDISV